MDKTLSTWKKICESYKDCRYVGKDPKYDKKKLDNSVCVNDGLSLRLSERDQFDKLIYFFKDEMSSMDRNKLTSLVNELLKNKGDYIECLSILFGNTYFMFKICKIINDPKLEAEILPFNLCYKSNRFEKQFKFYRKDLYFQLKEYIDEKFIMFIISDDFFKTLDMFELLMNNCNPKHRSIFVDELLKKFYLINEYDWFRKILDICKVYSGLEFINSCRFVNNWVVNMYNREDAIYHYESLDDISVEHPLFYKAFPDLCNYSDNDPRYYVDYKSASFIVKKEFTTLYKNKIYEILLILRQFLVSQDLIEEIVRGFLIQPYIKLKEIN
jgi:hypothetical protein